MFTIYLMNYFYILREDLHQFNSSLRNGAKRFVLDLFGTVKVLYVVEIENRTLDQTF